MEKNRTLLQQANQAFRNKNYEVALELYQMVGLKNPNLSSVVAFNINLIEKKGFIGSVFVERKTNIVAESLKGIIIKNKLFDQGFYLQCYDDVKESGVDPYNHYIHYGWHEGRNPSKIFDTSFYIDSVQDLKGLNPLEHYIEIGMLEGLKTNDFEHKFVDFSKLWEQFSYEESYYFQAQNPIDILIPVYNGYEYLAALFDSVFKNTSLSYRLLVCDDCSPDKRVLPYLEELASKYENFILYKNESNFGFVRTINKLSEYSENHFVLLNTDTEVPNGWLERLMYPIFSMEKIATTTPYTNSGTICSFPNYIEDNSIPHGLNVNQVDEYFKSISLTKSYIEIPTGVGFCMGVNKDVVNQIGMFDTVFGKGYGEENDFCQRAIKIGYKNIHVPNLYVYHKHGGSFLSEEKNKLIEKNLKILNQRNPNYDKDIAKAVRKDELSSIRKIIDFKIQSKEKKVVLFFDHGLGGGATHYLNDKIDLLIKENTFSVLVENNFRENFWVVKFFFKDKVEEVISFNSKKVIEFIFKELSVDEIFVNSIVGYDSVFSVIDTILKFRTNEKLVVPIHDYFPVCPSFTLLNQEGIYCGVPQDLTVCNNCLKNNCSEFKQFTKHQDVESWREIWGRLLSEADDILAFSQASIDIVLRAFNDIESKIKLIPHDISGRFEPVYSSSEIDQEELVIGVLGGINEAKGILVLRDLSKYIDENGLNIRVIVFGDTSIKIDSKCFKSTGRYEMEELPILVKKEKVSLFFIPSIWPETFSYTTDEVIQMGYPLAVFDLGAPAERVRRYNKGLLIDVGINSEILVNTLRKHFGGGDVD